MTTNNPLSEKAVLATVSISGWSARALDRKITDDTNKRHAAAADAGRFNKLLIAKEGLEKISKIAGAARVYHYSQTMPWFDEGARILPTARYAEYAKRIREFRAEYNEAANEFEKQYPALKEAAKARLGKMFRDEDYPSCHDIRMRFDFDAKIMPCPDAADFRTDLSAEFAADIRADIEERMKGALETAMQEPVRRIIDTVGKMAERLKEYKPATAKRRAEFTFKDSLVQNVRDLVSLLPSFNLTGDKALEQITKRIERDLCREEPGTLRDSKKVREEVAEKAAKIVADAQAFMA